MDKAAKDGNKGLEVYDLPIMVANAMGIELD
jgi:hypothetical protein